MSKPVLWHIEISHFNEKARWALDYKGVEHERRAPTPGAHMAVALWLTRGRHKTFPVLQLDGRGDRRLDGDHRRAGARASPTRRCIRRTRRAPPGAGARGVLRRGAGAARCACSPSTRRRRTRRSSSASRSTCSPAAWPSIGPVRAGAMRFFSTFTGLRYGVKSDRRAELAKAKVLAALDRLEAELGAGEYLVGDRFTVADLTAASLLYPLVQPPEGPSLPPSPAGFERFRAPLKERPGYRWVEEMFAKHRKPGRASDEVARRCGGACRVRPGPCARRRRSRRRGFRRSSSEPRRSPRPRPGRRTGARRRRSPSGRGGRPRPQSSRIRSVKPLITAGVLLKPGAQLTSPSALTQPADPVELAELLLQRGEDREPGEARGLVALLDREVAADLALHQDLGAVGGQVAGDVGEAAAHPDEVELELDPGRGGERLAAAPSPSSASLSSIRPIVPEA